MLGTHDATTSFRHPNSVGWNAACKAPWEERRCCLREGKRRRKRKRKRRCVWREQGRGGQGPSREGRAGGASYLQLGWRELGVQRDYQEPRADGPRAGWVSHAAIGMATERSAATRLTHLSEYGKVARSVLVSEVMRSTDGRKTRMPPSTCCRTKEMRCGVGQTGVASSLWCRDGKDAAARTVFVTRCATSAVMIDSSTAP